MIAAERRAVADLLEGLTPEQQLAQSLCEAWTVRQVAGHLIVPLEVSMPRFMIAMLRRRGNFDAANVDLAVRAAERPWREIVATLRAKAHHRFTPPGQGPAAPLTDVIVHSLDMTVPLGIAREIPEAHLRVALDHVATGAGTRVGSGVGGQRFEATDMDWAYGDGPVVSTPAQEILLRLAGRTPA